MPVNRSSTSALVLLIALPLLKLVIHLAVGSGYGYHGDELYYLACADHLDWSYVDHPPFSILVIAATRALLGDAITSIRIVPAIAGALTVLFVGLSTRRLGGGPLALAIAMIAAIVPPFYLAMDAYFSMNSIDLLIWAIGAWLAIGILAADAPGAAEPPRTRQWVALGILLGIGVTNKISVLWLGGGLFFGLLTTPHRRLLRTRGPWIAIGLAFLFFIPQIIWQATHDFATLRWMKGAAEDRPRAPLAFLAAQFDGMLPIVTPIWLAGLAYFFALRKGRLYRPLGWAWLAIAALLTFSGGGRPYYLGASYTWLLAGGAVAIEGVSVRRWAQALCVVYLLLVARAGLRAAPYVLPILPEARMADPVTKLPDFLSQMSGIDEIVGQLADAVNSVPAAERPRTMLLVAYYPIAGAVDLLGKSRGLPRASSSNNNYWFWGPQGSFDGPVVVMGYPEALIRDAFSDVSVFGATHCSYCRDPDHTILIARGLRIPPDTLWHRLKYRD